MRTATAPITNDIVLRGLQLLGMDDPEDLFDGGADEATEDQAEELSPDVVAMQAITAQLTVLADRLAVDHRLDALATQVSLLAQQVQVLTGYVTQPRVKVPIRDEAGRIVEVHEVVQPSPSVTA